MCLKSLRPRTPSSRGTVLIDKAQLWKGGPISKFTKGLKQTGGRGDRGRTCTYSRGGSHKRRYRALSALPSSTYFGRIQTVEYDPHRSAFICSVRQRETGHLLYTLAHQNAAVGDPFYSGDSPKRLNPGSRLPLSKVPPGALLFNLEMTVGRGPQYLRAAGSCGKIVRKFYDTRYCEVLLPSGARRLCSLSCRAMLGTASNQDHRFVRLGKAGRSRHLGRRPSVRGTAMNPVDHPLGGGNGKSRRGPDRTPWGKPAKGQPTRKAAQRRRQY